MRVRCAGLCWVSLPPDSEPPTWGEFAGASGPWPQLAASRLKSLPLNASAARLVTWVTSDYVDHVRSRVSRLITWDTLDPVGHVGSRAESRHPTAGAATWGVLCGVSPPNSPPAPQTLPRRAPSSWVCSQAAAAAVPYIEEGGGGWGRAYATGTCPPGRNVISPNSHLRWLSEV